MTIAHMSAPMLAPSIPHADGLSALALVASMATPVKDRSAYVDNSSLGRICSSVTCTSTKTSRWYKNPADRTKDLCIEVIRMMKLDIAF